MQPALARLRVREVQVQFALRVTLNEVPVTRVFMFVAVDVSEYEL